MCVEGNSKILHYSRREKLFVNMAFIEPAILPVVRNYEFEISQLKGTLSDSQTKISFAKFLYSNLALTMKILTGGGWEGYSNVSVPRGVVEDVV